jgi:type II secretory pathway component GspD/PulD (secretin)
MSKVRNSFAGAALLAITLALGLGSPALAGEGVDPAVYRQWDVGDGRITLDVQDALFGEVVENLIRPRTRINIFVSEDAAAQRVTVRAVNLHWMRVLSEMTDRISGVLVREDRNLIKIERPRPFSYTFEDQTLAEIVQSIAEFAEASIIIAPEILKDADAKLTVVLKNTPWKAALHEAVRSAGDYALVEEDYGILKVIPSSKLAKTTDYYRFRYLRPPAPYRGIVTNQAQGGSGGSGGGGGSSGGGGSDIVQHDVFVPTDDPSEQVKYFPIIEALAEVVAPDAGTVRYIPSTNTIIFSGTEPRVKQLKKMAEDLDVEPPQIFIDMNFVVTSNNDAINLGMDPGTGGLGASFQGGDIQTMLPFALGQPGGLEQSITGTAFGAVPAGAFSYGTLTTNQSRALFSFIQRDSSSRIVQAPKLLALDNHEATIFIGESVRYARSSATTDQNGGLVFGIEEDPNSPVNVGFQLLVIPHVIPGEQKIMMTVIPQRRTLTGNTSTLPGFDRFTVGNQSIDLPRVQSNTLLTHMILRDRETAVIGGLLEDREVKAVDKVPFFGDLPLAGLLFQGKEESKVKEHLLITITPRILNGTDAANPCISDALLGRPSTVTSEWVDQFGQAAQSPGQGESIMTAPPSVSVPSTPVPVAPGR